MISGSKEIMICFYFLQAAVAGRAVAQLKPLTSLHIPTSKEHHFSFFFLKKKRDRVGKLLEYLAENVADSFTWKQRRKRESFGEDITSMER